MGQVGETTPLISRVIMGPSYCDVIRGQATRLPMGPGHPPPIGILHVVSNVVFSFPSAAARLNELLDPQVNKAGGSAGARRNGICGDGVTRDGGIGSRTGTGRRESAACQRAMNGLRSDAHVAQQSRRDKLRVQSDLLQVRGASDPAMFPSPAASAATDFTGGSQVPLVAPTASSLILSEGAAAFQPQPGCDWAPPPSFVPHGHPYHHQPRPGFVGYHDGSTDLHFVSPSPPLACQGREFASAIAQQPCPWAVEGGGNELLFLPTYAGESPGAMLMARQLPPQWSGDGNIMGAKCDDATVGAGDPRAARGLSLTLASSPVPELGAAQLEAGPSCPYPKFLIGDRVYTGGGSLQDVVSLPSDAAAHRGSGPLGPFTGYATILKNSRFLRPAQQLLDEFCSAVTGLKLAKRCHIGEASPGASSSGRDVGEKDNSSKGVNSGTSTSMEAGADAGGAAKVHRPEFQQKKAKLLHMQEEVGGFFVLAPFQFMSSLSLASSIDYASNFLPP
ncbi:hypothetical protein GW17_00023398 [Ensete ventricosum]|nr:hypothetical protein GW17_00023398 [Ensete ventricosum]